MSQVSTTPILDTIKEKFSFGVDKLPLQGPDNLKTPCYGLFRDDTGEFMGSSSVTKKYTPHTTDDVLALCESVDIAFEGTASVKCHFDKGHYVQIEPSIDMRRNIYGTSDNIFPRFLIRGGYGGNGGSFSCSIMMWRDMCKNMHMMRSVGGTSVSIPHFSNLRSKMDELIATVSNLKDGWQAMLTAIEQMEQNRINMANFLDELYGRPTQEQLDLAATGQAVRAVTIHENRTTTIINRIKNERVVTRRNGGLFDPANITGWEAFNAVQWFTQHKATRRSNPSDFARMLSANQGSGGMITRQAEELAIAG